MDPRLVLRIVSTSTINPLLFVSREIIRRSLAK